MCPTLCDPIDSSTPGSTIPGILQARILEWVVISFSNACKLKVKVKSLSCVRLLATPWTAAYQAPPSMGFPGKSTGVGCHCFLQLLTSVNQILYNLRMNINVLRVKKKKKACGKPSGKELYLMSWKNSTDDVTYLKLTLPVKLEHL